MSRITCPACGRDVAAIPSGLGQWKITRHDHPGMHRDFKGALVSCNASLRPVELPDALSLTLLSGLLLSGTSGNGASSAHESPLSAQVVVQHPADLVHLLAERPRDELAVVALDDLSLGPPRGRIFEVSTES
ncbi:hypothetical protein ACIG3E_11280 [Streptomyces sp. NPDC053474]|uniref:hypothetical protein n=1 Tax=Streptomyces sp. NPDC053474 TaxID=3365704 RepID=UPI0037CD290D